MMGFTDEPPEKEVIRLYKDFKITSNTLVLKNPGQNGLKVPLIDLLFYRHQFVTILEILKHDHTSAPIIRRNILEGLQYCKNGNQYVSSSSEHQLISLGNLFALVGISFEDTFEFCNKDVSFTYLVPLAFGFVKERYVGWEQLKYFVTLINRTECNTISNIHDVDGYLKALVIGLKPYTTVENIPLALSCFYEKNSDETTCMMQYVLPIIQSNNVFTKELVLTLGDKLDALFRVVTFSHDNLGITERFRDLTQTDEQRENTSFSSFLMMVLLEKHWTEKDWKTLMKISLPGNKRIGDYYEHVFLCMNRFGVHNDIQRLILPFISLDVLL